jgi:hypothetical protein
MVFCLLELRFERFVLCRTLLLGMRVVLDIMYPEGLDGIATGCQLSMKLTRASILKLARMCWIWALPTTMKHAEASL